MTNSSRSNGNPAPIFVVGVPRSGTTLLAAMLAAHSRLSCGPESGFFDHLKNYAVPSLCDPRTWPRPAIDYLYSIKTLEQSVPENYGLSREQLELYLRARPPSVPAILEALTEQFRGRVGKQRWVEKTPSHCVHVEAIRRYFPAAPILRIVRDPRDVALSLRKQTWGPQTLVESVWRWRAFEAVSGPFFQSDRAARTVRYEDLVLAPEAEMREICSVIGERFEPGMLDTSQSIRQVNRINEEWKTKAGTPPDPSRVEAWKRVLTDGENRVFEALLGNHLLRYGYSCRDDFRGFAQVYPAGQSRYYWQALEGLVSEGYRFWPKHSREAPALRIFLNQPGGDGWLPGSRLARLRRTAAISFDLWRSRLSGRPVRWFAGEGGARAGGLCAQVLRLGLKPFTASGSGRGADPAPLGN